MSGINRALITSLVSLGLAGAAFAPGAVAAPNNGGYAKSAEALKAHQTNCSNLEGVLNKAVDLGLKAAKAGKTSDQGFYTDVAEVAVDLLQRGGCEGW